MTEPDRSPLDRDLQRKLLLDMPQVYPARIAYSPPPEEQQRYAANLAYLEDLGLCETMVEVSLNNAFYFRDGRITAKGLDFIANDGGLSAILGVITVRMHADTIRDLIAAKIEASAATQAEKSVLRKHLAALPETALRAGATDLVRLGLDHLPDAIPWLRTLVGL